MRRRAEALAQFLIVAICDALTEGQQAVVILVDPDGAGGADFCAASTDMDEDQLTVLAEYVHELAGHMAAGNSVSVDVPRANPKAGLS